MSRSMRVTHVVNDPPLLEQPKIFLRRIEGKLDVTSAQTPKNALDLLDKEDFDKFVFDYHIPDIEGGFVGKIRDNRTVSTLSMVMEVKKIIDHSDSLSRKSCEKVTTSGTCIYREGVTENFSIYDGLVESGVGNLDVPVKDESGEAFHVLWAILRVMNEKSPSNLDESEEGRKKTKFPSIATGSPIFNKNGEMIRDRRCYDGQYN